MIDAACASSPCQGWKGPMKQGNQGSQRGGLWGSRTELTK